jgi:hypothetical protein
VQRAGGADLAEIVAATTLASLAAFKRGELLSCEIK